MMINNIKILLIMAVVAFSGGNMTAQDKIELASRAYQDGKYSEAADIYNEIAKEKGLSAALLANMGNAYAKAGDFGHALICYERSLLLDPSDKVVKNNKAYILSKVEDGNKANAKGKNIFVVADEPSFFSRLKHYITHSHTSDTWAIWGGASFVLMCGCIVLYIFMREVLLRKVGFFGAIVLVFLCIMFMSFSYASAKASQAHDQGVIIGFKVTLLSEPFTSAKATGTPLERGTKLDILETESDQRGNVEWYKVRLNSEFAGWIQASEFEII